ncbi:electron transfer flavoprotein subunit alpha/FixB family protein [Ilumatobacter sp.]|uniref:electron transfer flavoprotein subunit alpha/FixB family protein n=1 Tax=Ilumatobacter sp. TaxID=1967498 RepID=UPI003B5266A4
MSAVLVVVEHDRGAMAPATLEAMTVARSLAGQLDATVEAVTIGASADELAGQLGVYGATRVHRAHDDVLGDYGPEAWGEVVAQAVRALDPAVVLATGTDRGNEVLAQAAARLDVPFVANVTDFRPNGSFEVTRVRWGGSLLEIASVDDDGARLATVAHHAVDAVPADDAAAGEAVAIDVDLDPSLARTVVTDRVEREAGVTLATAPVVVGGGRGVGSAEAFAPLQELALELGGVVGCSRAVTNNGWRNHTDQVGQTGTRIAPDVYFACGISGAIQHWVGAMASKQIVAINTDPQANMVTRAGYAVIGDLHEVVPAITAEIRRRRG